MPEKGFSPFSDSNILNRISSKTPDFTESILNVDTLHNTGCNVQEGSVSKSEREWTKKMHKCINAHCI